MASTSTRQGSTFSPQTGPHHSGSLSSIGRELSYSPAEAVAAIGALSRQAAAAAGTPARVIVKVQTLDWETQAPIPAAELDRALAAAAPGVSLAFVRGPDDPPLEVIRRRYRQ